ncbi:hypothetical protein LTR85_007280 [Meristemomyces frigidus]|nr:hypothetical protein LTR85_007280 [Meristemomyces frigidus]
MLTITAIPFLLAVVLFVGYTLLARRRDVQVDIPFHRFGDRPDTHEHYIASTRHLHYNGYKKFTKTEQPYRVQTSAGSERIILPLKYLTEVKNAPQSHISLPEEMAHLLLMDYTGVPQRTDSGTKVVRVDMTRQLGNLVTAMDEECVAGFQRFMPQCKDWTAVKIYPVLARIVAQISGRVLVGSELCRDEEWLRISIEFSTDAFGAARALRAGNKYPWSMLLDSYTSPSVARIREGRKKAAALLRPICEKRLASMSDPAWKRPNDGNQWLLDSHAHSGESIDEVVKSQLRLTMAAIHNTTMSITNDIFDLLAHPEYTECLREEVQQVLAEEGGWTKQALTKMRKLDSFMKESQRMTPSTMLTVKRKVLQDSQLHGGLMLRKGSHIAFASDGLNRDSDIYSSPQKFDGLRFYKLCAGEKTADNEARHQYVTATSEYLNWGQGRNACPGRFFASDEIKLMLAHLLLNFDIRWKAGEGRPESAVNDWKILPDREKEIEVSERVRGVV